MIDPAPKTVRVPGRTLTPGADRGIAALLTTATWVLASLPNRVVEDPGNGRGEEPRGRGRLLTGVDGARPRRRAAAGRDPSQTVMH
jgi:hypothetical protein